MEETITTLTLFHHPERFAEYVKDMHYWSVVCAYLDAQYDIDEAFLATYLKQVKEYLKQTSDNYGYDVGMIGNLSYKLKALRTQPSAEQKDMTEFELFKAGNRAWAKRFSPNEIWMMNQLKGIIKAQKLDLDMLEPFFEATPEPTERTQMIRELQLKLYGY